MSTLQAHRLACPRSYGRYLDCRRRHQSFVKRRRTIASVSRIQTEKAKTRRTRNDIALDVKSGGAGADGVTAPAVTLILSAKQDTRSEYLSMCASRVTTTIT